jgi:hypothetical protein
VSDSGREGGAARAAAEELETLVGRLGEEIASFRRRALAAEARVKALEAEVEQAQRAAAAAESTGVMGDGSGGEAPSASAQSTLSPDERRRLAALQEENDELRARLDGAAGRTRQMLERLRFLRQQHSLGGPR